MDPAAMKPYGLAILDYHRGNPSAVISVCRDDGKRDELPASAFFRQAEDYDLERVALGFCRGQVLDVGAGAGCHSLFLQKKGLSVCAIDVSPEAVQVCIW